MPAQLITWLRGYWDRILVALGAVVLFWIWRWGHLEWGTQRYVATWMDERIFVFAAVPVILAVLGLTRAAVATALSYPLLIVVGEVLGSAAWGLQTVFLGEEHQPIHVGWWIAVGLFVWVVLLSAWGEWRARRWERSEPEGRHAAKP